MHRRTRYFVRVGISENVAKVGARRCDKSPTTCPNTERNLEVFTSPTIHFLIVRANLIEVVLVDGEKTTRHCWRIYRIRDLEQQ